MNREILFRGKWTFPYDNSWNYGALLNDIAGGKPHILTDVYIDDAADLNFTTVPVDPATIGQYIGLTDKNGVKIFEGDILKGAFGTIFQVVYDESYFGFMAKEKSGFRKCIDYYGLEKIEIIGNVHDNPELMEGGNEK